MCKTLSVIGAAALLVGCGAHRTQLDILSQRALLAQGALKRTAVAAIHRSAIEEGMERGRALRDAGCSSVALEHPESAPLACSEIANAHQARYTARVQQVAQAVEQVNEALSEAWVALVDAAQAAESGELRHFSELTERAALKLAKAGLLGRQFASEFGGAP